VDLIKGTPDCGRKRRKENGTAQNQEYIEKNCGQKREGGVESQEIQVVVVYFFI
jgi:hypothetical protein